MPDAPRFRARPTAAAVAIVTLITGLSALAGSARAQETSGARPIPDVDDFVHDGQVGEWRARPIDRVLDSSDGLPRALVWVGRVREGVVVAAEIRSGLTAGSGATLRIGLAGPDSIRLPPMGWGHQFGVEVLADSTGCDDPEYAAEESEACRRWVARQVRHRARLPILFEREWRVPLATPDAVEEVRAGPAFAGLGRAARDRLGPLRPRGAPTALMRGVAGTEGGVGLEVLIPWGSFPPVSAPALAAARIRVDWADPDSAAAAGPWVGAASPRPFAGPLVQKITPCEYGLEGLLIPGEDGRFARPAGEGAVPYMIPEASGDLRSLIVLDNEAAGYQYAPDPQGLSPAAYELWYSVLDVGRGERLCAPLLALARAGSRVTPPDWTRTGEGDPFARQVDLPELETRRLDDGDFLVKSGPRVRWSFYGSGQCGACPRVGVDFFRVSADSGVVTSLLSILEIAEPESRDIELEVADDWTTVTLYRSETNWDTDPPAVRWDAMRFCRTPPPPGEEPAGFEPCGQEIDVAEPPRRLRGRYQIDP